MNGNEEAQQSFGTPEEEIRMMLAEAGHPDVPVRSEPDGWAIPLGDGPGLAPEVVHWRITQLVAQRYNDPDGPWCWACYQAGYDSPECEADFPMAQDCGRHRG